MKKLLKYLFGAAVSALILAGGSALTASADSSLIIQTSPSVTIVTPRQTTAATTITTTVTTNEITDTSVDTENSDVTNITDNTDITGNDITSDISQMSELSGITSETSVTVSTDISSSSREETGWRNINGKWYYYNGEKFLEGLQEIDGEPYLFAPNGALKTGWQTVKSARRYYDSETHSAAYGWVTYMGNIYYVTRESGKLTGINKIGNNTYIFGDSGIMQTGPVLCGDHMYCCDKEGHVLYGDDKKTPIKVGDTYYLISPKGYLMCGWQTVNGIRTFYDYDTGNPLYGWIEYQGHYYYSDISKGKYTGVNYIGSYPYRFNESGILETGIQYFENEGKSSYFYDNGDRAVSEIICINGGYYYFNKDGYTESGLVKVNNKTYYFDNEGKMLFGFQKIRAKTYYFDKNNEGAMSIGFLNIGNSRYYFDSNGVMKQGLNKIGGKTYYFDSSGKMLFGFQKINGNKYYFDDNGSMHIGFMYSGKDIYYFDQKGIMKYGFVKVDNKTYYFDSNGKMLFGFQKINGSKYYFGSDGSMSIGFADINNSKYYFGSNGKMCTGWQAIGNNRYYFGSDGKMYTYRHNINGVDYLFYSSGALSSTGNQEIVIKALSQLGQKGGRPYWTWWGVNYRFEWCACFVSWCSAQCGYSSENTIPMFISCKVGIEWFKAHGVWKNKGYSPKSGDIIFFDWESDGIADHVGIVDYCEDGYVCTVEGNSGDTVRSVTYKLDSRLIYGFASPNY